MDKSLIELKNGRTAVSFIPEDSTELAIVPLSVIQKLAKLLPKAHPKEIISDHILMLEEPLHDGNLKQAIEMSRDFVNFHVTVNLIANYDPDKDAVDVKEINIDDEREAMA